jgi:hypothetical protein
MSLDLPTVIQAMPYAAQVAQADMAHPEIQMAITQVLAQQMLDNQNKQAQPIEQQEALATVRDDARGRGRDNPRQRRRQAPAPQTEETQSGDDSPFAGQIIDLKI